MYTAPSHAGAPEEDLDTVTAADGLELATRSWAPASPRRGTVAIVHGLKDHSARYAGLASTLTAEGLSVHALDLRGHGRSPGPRAHVRRFADYLDDVDRFVRALRTEAPTGPLFLIGHSLGGAIALGFVLDGRARVDGLVLSAPALAPPPGTGTGVRGITRILGAVAPRLRILELPTASFSRSDETRAGMETDPLIFPGKATARLASETLGQMPRARSRFDRVTLPLLLLHGTADRITDPAATEELQRRAASPDKHLELYPGWYHDLLHEPDGDAVGRRIAEWLAIRLPDA